MNCSLQHEGRKVWELDNVNSLFNSNCQLIQTVNNVTANEYIKYADRVRRFSCCSTKDVIS